MEFLRVLSYLPLSSLFIFFLWVLFLENSVSFHCYAVDLQIYLPLTKKTNVAIDTLTACLADVKSWLSKNVLFLNPDKTEVIVFSPSEHMPSVQINLRTLNSFISPHVRNLGVVFDNSLKFDKQISAVVGSSFFHLRSLSKIKSFLSKSSLEVAIHAFITSRLDYCNSLYFGISKSQISRLQVVQNAAARFLKGCKKFDHATPLLC